MTEKKKWSKVVVLLCTLVVMCFSMSVSVFATDSQYSESEQAKNDLSTKVQSDLSSNTYSIDGGGTYSGSDLFKQDNGNGAYHINEDKFNELTSKDQTQFVQDIADSCDKQVKDSKDNSTGGAGTADITDSTVQNWWKELQSQKGVGSKFLNIILANTKPDFVTANAIYQPFSGVVGTVLGLIAVLLMAFLGIVMVSDIAYIALPPVRMLVSEGGDHGKPEKSKIFSHDAIYAVECAENNSDAGSGGGKQALGIYLKRRIVMLIILGICLLYLVQGQIYTLVGIVLDLVSGFLGF